MTPSASVDKSLRQRELRRFGGYRQATILRLNKQITIFCLILRPQLR
jgi:hypothetical protein